MDEERMNGCLSFHTFSAWATGLRLAADFAVGLALGFAYFNAVWWNARQFALGCRMTTAIALIIGRLGILGGFLVLASLKGAAPLLAMAGGVLIARRFVINSHRDVAT
jgi:F1F0 ATPase subunit 2